MNSSGQKIIFSVDEPVAVALASENGVLKKGRYGEYWTYFLEDERIMFVPPTVAEQIQKLEITTGQTFMITKTDQRTSQGLKWEVSLPGHALEFLEEESPIAEPVVAVEEHTPDATEAHEEKKKQKEPTDAGPQPHVWPEISELSAPSQTNGSAPGVANGKVNGSGHANGAAKQNGNANVVEPTASPLLKACLRAAIDAVIDAESYALSRSYHVRFTSEDIRAAGISVFIAAGHGGKR